MDWIRDWEFDINSYTIYTERNLRTTLPAGQGVSILAGNNKIGDNTAENSATFALTYYTIYESYGNLLKIGVTVLGLIVALGL